MISTSSIRISCVVRGADAERAVRAVHEKFGLSEEVSTAARDEHSPQVPALGDPGRAESS